jgi:hypothetical protein
MGKEACRDAWDTVNSDLAPQHLILLRSSPFKGKVYSRKSYLCLQKSFSMKRVCMMVIDAMGKCN